MQKLKPSPDQFLPVDPRDLIGGAHRIAPKLLTRARKLLRIRASLKLLLYGPPGTGKTSILNMIAASLTAHKIDIEKISGVNVSIEIVREWQRNSAYGSLFGGWRIKQIDEVDRVPTAAQDLMLSYLDDLPARNGVIASSNLNLDSLTERFQTRFQLVRVQCPSGIELTHWLSKRWRIPERTAQFITMGACGNVRQALLDAQNFLDFGSFDAHRPKPPEIVKDPAASARALKAWETMRGKAGAA